jgi:hypothetical protein
MLLQHEWTLKGSKQDYKDDESAIAKAIEKVIHQLLISLWIHTKIARTVNKGAAVIVA